MKKEDKEFESDVKCYCEDKLLDRKYHLGICEKRENIGVLLSRYTEVVPAVTRALQTRTADCLWLKWPDESQVSSLLQYTRWRRGRSELGIDDLGSHLTDALADICVVKTVGKGRALLDTLGETGAVGNEETSSSGGQLAVLLVVIESGQFSNHS